MKKINICYDDVNELAMELTDEILNVFEDKNNSEHIKIYIDDNRYCWDLQDIIKDKILKRFKIKED